MEISFVRSGGFAGSATNVAGGVHFDANGARVSATGTDYSRNLSADEAKQLQDLASARPAQGGAAPVGSPVRDGFQYDLSVKTQDGKTHSFTPAPASELLDWVQRETQRIWEHRLASVPK